MDACYHVSSPFCAHIFHPSDVLVCYNHQLVPVFQLLAIPMHCGICVLLLPVAYTQSYPDAFCCLLRTHSHSQMHSIACSIHTVVLRCFLLPVEFIHVDILRYIILPVAYIRTDILKYILLPVTLHTVTLRCFACFMLLWRFQCIQLKIFPDTCTQQTLWAGVTISYTIWLCTHTHVKPDSTVDTL